MADQAWFPTDGSSSEAFAAPPPHPSARPPRSPFELRPLTTGELLDRTFHLYRSNFWLFVSLAAIAAGVNTVAALIQVGYMHAVGMAQPNIFGGAAARTATQASVGQNLLVSSIAMVSSFVYLAVYSVTQAATTSAVTAIYLGDSTSMGAALKAVKGRWFRFVLIGLWQIWSAMWALIVAVIAGALLGGGLAFLGGAKSGLAAGLVMGVVMIAGFVYGAIAYIRNSFAVPASVMEDLKIRKAMRRSKNLTSGSKGRVFLLFLFVFVLYMVAIGIGAPLSVLAMQNKTAHTFLLQGLNIAVGLVTGSVIGPIGAIGLCLFYIDQRIRKEGFDLEFMMERSEPLPVVDLGPHTPVVYPAEQS